LGTVAMAGVVPRLSATPGEVRHAGRAVGEDTRTVLAAVLGYDADKISGLERRGVIACAAGAG
jgi:crotonobetainyl-CoA:carnitine CoA-transferase CaiB-like acyl-CoA transferase